MVDPTRSEALSGRLWRRRQRRSPCEGWSRWRSCSSAEVDRRRTSPGTGKQRPYVATTEQVWALHNAVPAGIRPAILLGAHAGLRLAEAAALRPEDVDFIRGVVSPAIQWPNEPLKSHTSKTPIPIPNELSLELSATFARGRGLTIVTAEDGRPIAGPWAIERAVRNARAKVEG